MSIIDRIRNAIATPAAAGNVDVHYSLGAIDQVRKLSPAQMYRTQPHLRAVVEFRAINVAQLGLHVFNRADNDGRVRSRDSIAARLLRRPNANQTQYELIRDLVSDLSLYGVAFWALAPDADADSGWTIRPIPPTWVSGYSGGTVWDPAWIHVLPPGGTPVKLPAREFIIFRDYIPGLSSMATTPVEALRDVLVEQLEAWQFRRQIWKRGGRVGTYLSRPKDAPVWTEAAAERFRRDWNQFQSGGARAGSTPLLEDGMEIRRIGFSAREEEWAEATKLSLQTVAAVYHISPAMITGEGGSSHSAMREFRSMLYTESLGPVITMISARINHFLIPRIDPESVEYAEFNIEAKLAGNFEEQAAIFSTATGAPWMTVNEARARRNLPAVDGGDDLVVPLNVIKGGQASPQSGEAPALAVENERDGQ